MLQLEFRRLEDSGQLQLTDFVITCAHTKNCRFEVGCATPLDHDYNTPLHYACFHGSKESLDAIISMAKMGWADLVLRKNLKGYTPLDVCRLHAMYLLVFVMTCNVPCLDDMQRAMSSISRNC